MAKYEYDKKREVFVRKDKRGNHLAVNIVEAQRIVHFMNLGYSINDIQGKMNLVSPKGTASTVKSFIRNYLQGNIEMPDDAPAPSMVFDSMTDNDRLTALEERVTALENAQKCECHDAVENMYTEKSKTSWKDSIRGIFNHE